MNQRPVFTRAFTLVELLVVIAVIGILISVLLPALSTARGAAQKIGGANIQKNLVTAQMAFAATNDDAYAGPATSGAIYRTRRYSPFGYVHDDLAGNTSSSTPVSPLDWVSPTIGEAMNFSPNRAERYADILNDLGCPSAVRLNDEVYNLEDLNSPFSNVKDEERQFDRILLTDGFNQISFVTPWAFHMYPHSAIDPNDEDRSTIPVPGAQQRPNGPRQTLTTSYVEARGRFTPPATVPDSFRPRLDRVGATDRKVLVADGCQYYTRDGILDFDVNPEGLRGAFMTFGPIRRDSFAYTRGEGNTSPDSWLLSVRHNGNTQINTGRFDGSVQTISVNTLWADPSPWFPRGSRWTGSNATQESIEFMDGEEFVN